MRTGWYILISRWLWNNKPLPKHCLTLQLVTGSHQYNVTISECQKYRNIDFLSFQKIVSHRSESPDSHGEAGGMWSNQMTIRRRQWQIHHRSHNNWSRHQSGDGLVRKKRVNFPNPRHPDLPLTSFINLRWHLQVGSRCSNKLWLDISQSVSLLSPVTDILLSMKKSWTSVTRAQYSAVANFSQIIWLCKTGNSGDQLGPDPTLHHHTVITTNSLGQTQLSRPVDLTSSDYWTVLCTVFLVVLNCTMWV